MTEAATVFGMIGQVVVIFAGLVAAYVGFKKWIKKTVTAGEGIQQQLATGNGKVAGELLKFVSDQVKVIGDQVASVSDEVSKHSDDLERTQVLVKDMAGRVDVLDRRMDRHFLYDHSGAPTQECLKGDLKLWIRNRVNLYSLSCRYWQRFKRW